MEGMEQNHFMTILLLDPYFRMKSWIYKGILGVLVKKSLNIISFPLKLKGKGENVIRFNEFFTKISKIPLYT